MKILTATVGPIVGYTTPTQTRIFLRGDAIFDAGDVKRCFAIVRVKPTRETAWQKPLSNKLSPHFDVTAVIVVDGLAPDTQYDYQAGWFLADVELENIATIPEDSFEWEDQVFCFRTGVVGPAVGRSYVVGSCRYLLKLFGGLIFDERGDKAFRSILDQIYKEGRTVDALVMIGDQIYADDLGRIEPDQRIDQFLARYRDAFSQPFIRELMSQVPTYMILDDHEIEDNWPENASGSDLRTLFPHAMQAYQIYQCSHSPVFPVADGRIEGTPKRFWYTFEDGCAQWFVLDARTERDLNATPPKMIGDAQMQALLAWLSDGSDQVKLIVSSIPVFPDMTIERKDKWGGFTAQRRQLIEHIFSERIRKVIFVSGDLHCSFVTRLTSPAAPDFHIHSVVSSSLFWPFFHTREASLTFGVPLSDMGETVMVSTLISEVYSGNNFVRLDVSSDHTSVALYERKGDRIQDDIVLRY